GPAVDPRDRPDRRAGHGRMAVRRRRGLPNRYRRFAPPNARPISALRHGIAKQWGLVLPASLDGTRVNRLGRYCLRGSAARDSDSVSQRASPLAAIRGATTPQAFQQAIALHEQGRLAEAARPFT